MATGAELEAAGRYDLAWPEYESEGNALLRFGNVCDAAEAYVGAVRCLELLVRSERAKLDGKLAAFNDAMAASAFAAAAAALAPAQTLAQSLAALQQKLEEMSDAAAEALYRCASLRLERGEELITTIHLFGRSRDYARGEARDKAAAGEEAARQIYRQIERERNEAVQPGGR